MEKTFSVSFDHLYPMLEFVRERANSAGLTTKKISDIEHAVEEAVSNIILHAGLNTHHPIHISCNTVTPSGIQITISDPGIAFNPLKKPSGSLGIYLMTSLMDHIAYRRINNQNQLTMTKH